MSTEQEATPPAWDREPESCWSCGGKAEARDDIHVRCLDTRGIDCEVMMHWFTRKTWNTRSVPDSFDTMRDALREIAWGHNVQLCRMKEEDKGCGPCIASSALAAIDGKDGGG